eukprot:6231838-Pyramimonas_sp.AAC.1
MRRESGEAVPSRMVSMRGKLAPEPLCFSKGNRNSGGQQKRWDDDVRHFLVSHGVQERPARSSYDVNNIDWLKLAADDST